MGEGELLFASRELAQAFEADAVGDADHESPDAADAADAEIEAGESVFGGDEGDGVPGLNGVVGEGLALGFGPGLHGLHDAFGVGEDGVVEPLEEVFAFGGGDGEGVEVDVAAFGEALNVGDLAHLELRSDEPGDIDFDVSLGAFVPCPDDGMGENVLDAIHERAL